MEHEPNFENLGAIPPMKTIYSTLKNHKSKDQLVQSSVSVDTLENYFAAIDHILSTKHGACNFTSHVPNSIASMTLDPKNVEEVAGTIEKLKLKGSIDQFGTSNETISSCSPVIQQQVY